MFVVSQILIKEQKTSCFCVNKLTHNHHKMLYLYCLQIKANIYWLGASIIAFVTIQYLSRTLITYNYKVKLSTELGSFLRQK